MEAGRAAEQEGWQQAEFCNNRLRIEAGKTVEQADGGRQNCTVRVTGSEDCGRQNWGLAVRVVASITFLKTVQIKAGRSEEKTVRMVAGRSVKRQRGC